jgi:predicted CXXCH cytochrome family protein
VESASCKRSALVSFQVEIRVLSGFFLILILCLYPSNFLHTGRVSASELISQPLQADPHDAVQCYRCHSLETKDQAFDKEKVKYDTDALCMECHDSFCMHPVGISADRSKLESEEMDLPLVERAGDFLISCLTCHNFHGMQTSRYLLRYTGNSQSERFNGLCYGCHLEDTLIAMSPHNLKDSKCTMCHSKLPEKDEVISGPEYYEMQRRCDFCHGLVAINHYRSIDPLADLRLSARAKDLGLTMIDGGYACFSCHDPHGELSIGQDLLKSDYLKLVAVSRNVNPHWKNVMCVTCHEDKPEKGEPNLLMNGDVNGLCIRCHNAEVSKAFLHPVDIEPSEKVHIPDDMPLSNGKITCQTCHKSSLQETGEEISVALRTNSSFLRVADYSPADFCLQCHIQELFSKVNVHEQLTENGDIRTEMCAGCHFVLPEDDGDPTLTTGWDVDPKEFCLLCHRKGIYTKDHPAGPHLVEPSRDTLYTLLDAENRIGAPLPLYEDRITCSTCHDPHQNGVLTGHNEVDIASGKHGVRAMYREILCTGCHDSGY